jgi:ribosomal protein S18 acetylase RimI-like enzyme
LHKAEFLGNCLGPAGRQNYETIVNWMSEQSAPHVGRAWYLSIVGITPQAQGRGLGSQLLLPTLADADAAGADCYLETFSARNIRFYERLGFHTLRVFLEPTTRSEYSLMIRR